jgi:PilZ domain
MAASSLTSSHPKPTPSPDDRREWVRIDDRLLLEYHLLDGPPNESSMDMPPITEEMIATTVTKPTADLLARSGEILAGSPILPWMMKVDYMLAVILKSLAHTQPASVAMAQVMEVNISGGGVNFVSAREFAAGDNLALKIILPPFTPIQTVAKVIRATACSKGEGFMLATEFVGLKPDDQEHLIRHIIQTQAEQLRARRAAV